MSFDKLNRYRAGVVLLAPAIRRRQPQAEHAARRAIKRVLPP